MEVVFCINIMTTNNSTEIIPFAVLTIRLVFTHLTLSSTYIRTTNASYNVFMNRYDILAVDLIRSTEEAVTNDNIHFFQNFY